MSKLSSHLKIENGFPFGKLLLFTKDEKSDLGFAFGELLSSALKRNIPIIFLNLTQSFNHYSHLLMKFGVNVKSLKDSGLIVNIDFLKLTEYHLQSSGDAPEDNSKLSTILNSSNSPNLLKPLYESIKNAVDNLNNVKGYTEGFVVFIDELNVLQNLGISNAAIQIFVQYCCSLCSINTGFQGGLVMGAQDDSQDPECHYLMTYLAHNAHVRVNVQGLSTGYSADVHGKIMIKSKIPNGDDIQKMLFKVDDKGAKLFPFGM